MYDFINMIQRIHKSLGQMLLGTICASEPSRIDASIGFQSANFQIDMSLQLDE